LPSKLSISEIKRLYDITPDSSVPESEAAPPIFEPPKFLSDEGGLTAAKIGSALHKIIEHIDLVGGDVEGLISDLAGKNILSVEEAEAISREKIKNFLASPLAGRMRMAESEKKLFRETPFVLQIPAVQVFAEARGDEKILVHGIIDCYFEENGKIVLVDFKSDRIKGDANEWAKKHATQLKIYKQALQKATKLEVCEVLLYSFFLDRVLNFSFDGL
jgi:ATP-dependent helicase/nuclease subunit A